ncbi:MAG: hypothetical protein ACRC92_20555 [Peptostreptococcaceae bacterium]
MALIFIKNPVTGTIRHFLQLLIQEHNYDLLNGDIDFLDTIEYKFKYGLTIPYIKRLILAYREYYTSSKSILGLNNEYDLKQGSLNNLVKEFKEYVTPREYIPTKVDICTFELRSQALGNPKKTIRELARAHGIDNIQCLRNTMNKVIKMYENK